MDTNTATATRTADAIQVTLPTGQVVELKGKATAEKTRYVVVGEWLNRPADDPYRHHITAHASRDAATKERDRRTRKGTQAAVHLVEVR